MARPPVRLRRVPRVRDGRRNRPDRRRAHLRAVAAGAPDSDRRHAEHQLAPIGAAWRRELAHAASVLPDEVVPGHQRRVHGQSRRRTVRPARPSEGALHTVRRRAGRAHLAADRPRRPRPSKRSSASKSYAPHHDYIFPPRVFTELQNAQAIALPYDGLNPLPPQFCYLKPHYLDVQTSYFDHLARGAL